MKTAKEILKDLGIDDKLEIDTSLPYPKGLRYLTSEAMEIYADQQLAEYKEKLKEKLMQEKTFSGSEAELYMNIGLDKAIDKAKKLL